MSQAWFESKITEEFGALRQHAEPLRQLLAGNISSNEATERLVSSDLNRRDDTTWRLWQLIFDVAAELPQHQETIIEFMLTLQVKRENGSKDPGLTAFLRPFASNWRDRHDIYWARREGLYEKPPGRGDHKSLPGPGERFVNFDAFSAKLISSPYKSAVGLKVMAWSQLSRLLEEDRWNLSSLHDERSRNADEKGALMCLDTKATMQYILHAAS